MCSTNIHDLGRRRDLSKMPRLIPDVSIPGWKPSKLPQTVVSFPKRVGRRGEPTAPANSRISPPATAIMSHLASVTPREPHFRVNISTSEITSSPPLAHNFISTVHTRPTQNAYYTPSSRAVRLLGGSYERRGSFQEG